MPGVSPSLPSAELLRQQAEWLAPARAGLLRTAAIAHCNAILDLGAGRGMVTPELLRRGAGQVYAIDNNPDALYEAQGASSAIRIVGDGRHLPFREQAMDLVFSQFALLWMGDPVALISEVFRILVPSGRLCAIEPDYPGLIEYPAETAVADIWLAALNRAGAICDIGRQLPGILERQGFSVQVRLLDQLQPPSPLRFAMLREMPLEPQELAELEGVEQVAAARQGWQQLAHLPLFLINATKAG